jgi:molecular chaperone GrpE
MSNNGGKFNSSEDGQSSSQSRDEKSQANEQEQDPQRLGDSLDEAIPADAIAEARNEADKFKNEYLYLRAEFDNFKKQVIKERSDLRKYGCERFVVDILGVLDILETALATELTPETMATFRKGIEMTSGELKNVLTRHGVTEVPAKGQPFDPASHEALSSEETNEVPSGTITQVFKKPYRLHDRVVRPGQVIVAKPKS